MPMPRQREDCRVAGSGRRRPTTWRAVSSNALRHVAPAPSPKRSQAAVCGHGCVPRVAGNHSQACRAAIFKARTSTSAAGFPVRKLTAGACPKGPPLPRKLPWQPGRHGAGRQHASLAVVQPALATGCAAAAVEQFIKPLALHGMGRRHVSDAGEPPSPTNAPGSTAGRPSCPTSGVPPLNPPPRTTLPDRRPARWDCTKAHTHRRTRQVRWFAVQCEGVFTSTTCTSRHPAPFGTPTARCRGCSDSPCHAGRPLSTPSQKVLWRHGSCTEVPVHIEST